MEKLKKPIITIVVVLSGVITFSVAILAACYYIFIDPYRNTVEEFQSGKNPTEVISNEAAVADLDYIYGMMTDRHPAWLLKTEDSEKTDEMYKAKREYLMNKEDVRVIDVWKSASAMMSQLHDAHTACTLYYEDSRVLDKLYNLPDSAIVAVDGTDTKELYNRFTEIFSYEIGTEDYAKNIFAGRLVYEKYLLMLDIDTSDGVDISFENGETLHCDFVSTEVAQSAIAEKETVPEKDFYYDIYEKYSLGVLTINTCELTEEYSNTLWNFFEQVSRRKLKNVAIDIRKNTGGTSLVINELFRYFDVDGYYLSGGNDVRIGGMMIKNGKEYIDNHRQQYSFSGNVYVLTSCNTFSSAMMLAHAVHDNGIGTIVGEVCGNTPDQYGDILMFQTKNCGIAFTVSHKVFYRIDENLRGQALIPDIKASADNALEKLQEIISGKENS